MIFSGALVSLAVIAAILALVFLGGHKPAAVSRAKEALKADGLFGYLLPIAASLFLALMVIWRAGLSPDKAAEPAPGSSRPPATAESRDEERKAAEAPRSPAAESGAPKPEPREQTTRGLPRPAPSTPAEPPPASAGNPPPAPESGPAAGPLPAEPRPDVTAPPPPPSPAGVDGDKYTVVPVYYGTDRERRQGVVRIEYGAERGRRLEIGRALVSVPTSHEEPRIERPWALRVPYFDVKIYEEKEDPEKHFTLRELKTLTREELSALVAERLGLSKDFPGQALVFVHGFNTSFDNAVYRTAQIVHDLEFDGAPFLYSWPSGGAVASYTYDRESAGQAEPFMRDFMGMVVEESQAKAVSVIAHSMGNQLLLPVLKDLKASSPGVIIHQVILAAPDVDRDNFENIAREIKGLAKGITLYAASNDRALGVSRRFHGGVPRAGDVPPSGPVVLDGVDTIDVTAVSTDSLGINHSGYAESNALLTDIKLLLQTGERPPDKRIPILARISGPKGDYWRYPGGR